eukprot:766539-Rhodomonas_salina.1
MLSYNLAVLLLFMGARLLFAAAKRRRTLRNQTEPAAISVRFVRAMPFISQQREINCDCATFLVQRVLTRREFGFDFAAAADERDGQRAAERRYQTLDPRPQTPDPRPRP